MQPSPAVLTDAANGGPHMANDTIAVLNRFFKKIRIDPASGCWIWMASKCSDGYGTFRFNGRVESAHRASYQLFVGPIPEGLHIDHKCHIPEMCLGGPDCPHRACVNAEHMEPVPCIENIRRGRNKYTSGAKKRALAACPSGHPYDEINTYKWMDAIGKWHRQCQICRQKHRVASRARGFR